MILKPELSLAELQEAFARWRQTRRPRQIPPALGANAVALLGQHRTTEILKALRIDHRTLKRWKGQYGGGAEAAPKVSAAAFVTLAPPPSVAAEAACEVSDTMLKFTRQAGDGTALSVEGRLTLAQWRAAMSLLQSEEGA